MSNLIDTMKEIADIRYKASQKCSKLFSKAVGSEDFVKENWPPRKEIKLLSDKELNDNTYHALETDMPWLIFDKIPGDKLKHDEKSNMIYVDIDYAAENGYLGKRVMSRRLCADLEKIKEQEEQYRNLLKETFKALSDEVQKYEDISHISDVDIYAHLEGSMITVFMACIVAARPTPENMETIKIQELHGRLMALMKALPALEENKPPNPKNWEWHFTKKDSELAVKMINRSNPGSEVVKNVDDLKALPFMGVEVKDVKAKETEIRLKLDLVNKK